MYALNQHYAAEMRAYNILSKTWAVIWFKFQLFCALLIIIIDVDGFGGRGVKSI